MNTNLIGFRCFSQLVVPFSFYESRHTIGRVNNNAIFLETSFLFVLDLTTQQPHWNTLECDIICHGWFTIVRSVVHYKYSGSIFYYDWLLEYRPPAPTDIDVTDVQQDITQMKISWNISDELLYPFTGNNLLYNDIQISICKRSGGELCWINSINPSHTVSI